MDILVSSAYLCVMFDRLVTMLAILAITVVTTAASAHAARMSYASGPEHASHVGGAMHSPDPAQLACEGEDHCGSADAGVCEFVCASLSAFLTSPVADSGPAYGPARHGFPSEASHFGHAPDLNERPPKLRLL
ncbi:hypothetical protein EF888_05295 [Silicimonas algicola]|nr:hypothetical protein EF888_05295 [Silicimonas algicola]